MTPRQGLYRRGTSYRDPEFGHFERTTHRTSTSDNELTSDNNEKDKDLVTWDRPDDPENPLNWPQRTKWSITFWVSCYGFISPFASTMVTPAVDRIGKDFGIESSFTRALIMSIFLLGFAQGPFLLSPLSEIYGRVAVLQWSNVIFLAFNTACGFAKTTKQMLIFRFLAGIGGAAPQTLCQGVLADTWRKEERGKGQSIYGSLLFVGPAVAPIFGAFVTRDLGWRWIFWILSIFDAVVQLFALIYLRETYAPVLLICKARKLRKETANQDLKFEREDEPFLKILWQALARPFVMLLTHPAVQAPSLYRAFMYGVNYLVYLSRPLMDRLYAYLKRRYKIAEGQPEWRVPPMLIGGIICTIGLFIYGWSAQTKIHWIVPDIGSAIFSIGLMITFQCSQAYIVDAYGEYAASASAAGAFLRAMCGFGFPLFAPKLYSSLGYGWGNSLLAFVTLGLAIPSLILLWFYGAKFRRWSGYIPG